MTEYLVICLAALVGSGLTLFSGFGLGTLLVPVFAVFVPVEVAIVLTAIVHFLNNLFKLGLFWQFIDKSTLLRFGIPAIIAAFAGAWLLTLLTGLQPLFRYTLFGKEFLIEPVNLVVAILLIVFALFELIPALVRLEIGPKYLPLGGLLSGFFGGLSGNQGALRSAFLIRANLSKEGFVATGVAIACLVDISRLSVYASQTIKATSLNYALLTAATLSAFLGAYLGNQLLGKITIRTLQYFVAVMLLVFAFLLGLGII